MIGKNGILFLKSDVMEEWLDRNEYPFQSKYFDLPMGRMHYVDEGESAHAIVMVHGNPAWSYTYRKLVKCLSNKYRCIAPDHIGFGLSDKPIDWDYLPENHAANFEKLLNHLDMQSITLIVGDWGGPIGLSYAVNHPDKIKKRLKLRYNNKRSLQIWQGYPCRNRQKEMS